MGKKLIWVCVLFGIFLLSLYAGGSGETAKQGPSMAAKPEVWSEVVAAAQKEGKVVVYATTSRITLAAENFTKKTGIKADAHRLSEVELIERLNKEAASGITAADVVLIEDYPSMMETLVKPGYLVNYIPPSAREGVPKEYQTPLVFAFVNRIFGYNTEKYPKDPFQSIWDLTLPEWKGRVMIRDLVITGEHQNAFTELIRRSDELEKEYQRRFGKPLEKTEKNAGYEFMKRLVQNDIILMKSDTTIAESVGKRGQADPPVGFFYVFSKHRDIPKKNLALAYSVNIKPFIGYYYGMYLQLTAKAKNPNAAKVLADYLISPEGYKPWSDEMGFYSTNAKVPPYPDDKPWSWWKEHLWTYDPAYAAEHRGEVLDAWIKYVQKK